MHGSLERKAEDEVTYTSLGTHAGLIVVTNKRIIFLSWPSIRFIWLSEITSISASLSSVEVCAQGGKVRLRAWGVKPTDVLTSALRTMRGLMPGTKPKCAKKHTVGDVCHCSDTTHANFPLEVEELDAVTLGDVEVVTRMLDLITKVGYMHSEKHLLTESEFVVLKTHILRSILGGTGISSFVIPEGASVTVVPKKVC